MRQALHTTWHQGRDERHTRESFGIVSFACLLPPGHELITCSQGCAVLSQTPTEHPLTLA